MAVPQTVAMINAAKMRPPVTPAFVQNSRSTASSDIRMKTFTGDGKTVSGRFIDVSHQAISPTTITDSADRRALSTCPAGKDLELIGFPQPRLDGGEHQAVRNEHHKDDQQDDGEQ